MGNVETSRLLDPRFLDLDGYGEDPALENPLVVLRD
jgi:hypothetical protein